MGLARAGVAVHVSPTSWYSARVPDTSLVVTLGLATFWLTYVVTRSEFPPVSWLRERVFVAHERARNLNRDRLADVPRTSSFERPLFWATYLLTCPWCAAPYVASALVLAVVHLSHGAVATPFLVVLSASALTGFLQTVVDRLERPSSPPAVVTVSRSDA